MCVWIREIPLYIIHVSVCSLLLSIDPLCSALSGGGGKSLSLVQQELLQLLDESLGGSEREGGGREETRDDSRITHLAAMKFDTGIYKTS